MFNVSIKTPSAAVMFHFHGSGGSFKHPCGKISAYESMLPRGASTSTMAATMVIPERTHRYWVASENENEEPQGTSYRKPINARWRIGKNVIIVVTVVNIWDFTFPLRIWAWAPWYRQNWAVTRKVFWAPIYDDETHECRILTHNCTR